MTETQSFDKTDEFARRLAALQRAAAVRDAAVDARVAEERRSTARVVNAMIAACFVSWVLACAAALGGGAWLLAGEIICVAAFICAAVRVVHGPFHEGQR